MPARLFRLVVALLAVVGILALIAGIWLLSGGISARGEAGPFETRVARRLRAFAIPAAARTRRNPVPAGNDVIADGLAHYADHCAVCHANDGSGDTEMGRGLYPKPPDLRRDATQSLSDGELFYIIENGVRFTGMPGWATGTAEGEAASWRLIQFIRHLPRLTPAEEERMRSLNPKGPDEWRELEEEQRFLAGEDTPSGPPHEHGDHR